MWYGYGLIPINTIFRGMNIHLQAILMFTRGTRFWPTAISIYNMCEQHQAPWNTYNPHRENAMRPQNGSYHVLSSYFPVFQGTVAHDFSTWFFSHPNKWFEMEIIDAHLVNVPYFGTSLPTVPAVWWCKIRPTLARCCRSSAHNSPSSSVNGLEVSEAEHWDIWLWVKIVYGTFRAVPDVWNEGVS